MNSFLLQSCRSLWGTKVSPLPTSALIPWWQLFSANINGERCRTSWWLDCWQDKVPLSRCLYSKLGGKKPFKSTNVRNNAQLCLWNILQQKCAPNRSQEKAVLCARIDKSMCFSPKHDFFYQRYGYKKWLFTVQTVWTSTDEQTQTVKCYLAHWVCVDVFCVHACACMSVSC